MQLFDERRDNLVLQAIPCDLLQSAISSLKAKSLNLAGGSLGGIMLVTLEGHRPLLVSRLGFSPGLADQLFSLRFNFLLGLRDPPVSPRFKLRRFLPQLLALLYRFGLDGFRVGQSTGDLGFTIVHCTTDGLVQKISQQPDQNQEVDNLRTKRE